MYPELQDRVAVVSGAGGALGGAVVQRFADEGMRLVLIDRSADALAEKWGGLADRVLLASADLTRTADVDALLENAVTQFGRVDVLANIAGAFTFSGPVHEAKPEDLDAMFAANEKTAYLLSAACAKRMVAGGNGGRIVNVAARVALAGAANMAAYSASKAAVKSLTESMAAELLPHGVTVNAVLPSTIDTPANRRAMPDADFTTWVAPESLASVIAFLASDGAHDISGAAIPVYGRA